MIKHVGLICYILALLLVSSLACDTSRAPASGHGDGYTLYPKLPYVTGHIDRVDPEPDNARYFRLVVITDADGARWEFRSAGWTGVSVGHIKDHQIQGTMITVWYETQPDGSLLARFVGD